MLQAKYFIGATPYQDGEAMIQDALRHLLRARPELRIRMAVLLKNFNLFGEKRESHKKRRGRIT